MEQKIGEAFFHDMVDRGRRELGGVMFEGSNVAQPQYPLRGSYGPPKQLDGPEPSGIEPGGDERFDRRRSRVTEHDNEDHPGDGAPGLA